MQEGEAWDRLADAVLISGRTDKTIQAWCATGEIRPGEYRVDTTRRQGSGHAFWVKRSALRRVHLAHDGAYWHPDAPLLRLPPMAQARIRELQERVRELEKQVADYSKVIGQRRAGGWDGVAPELLARLEADARERAPDADAESYHPAPPRPAPIYAAAGSAAPAPKPHPPAGGLGRYPAVDAADIGLPSDGAIPEGCVSASAYAKRHGFTTKEETIWRNSMKTGAFLVIKGNWREGSSRTASVLDAQGRRTFVDWWRNSRTKHYRPCGDPACECMAPVEDPAAPRTLLPTMPRALAGVGG